MKLTKEINYRVVIDVPQHRWIDSKKTQENHERLMYDECRQLVDDIKRHIDTEEKPTIESTTVCKFCEYPWEVDTEGRPVCCDKAVSEWQGMQPDSQQFGVGA